MMTIIEHIHPGFQWAEPLNGQELQVENAGAELRIMGCYPSYSLKDGSPCDLIGEFRKFPKELKQGWLRTKKYSPEMLFSNADSDEKLIAFTRRFGPVVAKSVELLMPDKSDKRKELRLIACQDLQELRNEQSIYRAALELLMQLGRPNYDYYLAQELIKAISSKIHGWQQQWEREKSLSGWEPEWKLDIRSLKRIEELAECPRDRILPDQSTGRIIICELLNTFPAAIFPNLSELHSSIRFGVRPLLYSLLRRHLISPSEFSICSNIQCRSFFSIERSNQQFCSPECSQHHRQRIYWEQRGNKLRKKRKKSARKKNARVDSTILEIGQARKALCLLS